jgi:hypothetical protein
VEVPVGLARCGALTRWRNKCSCRSGVQSRGVALQLRVVMTEELCGSLGECTRRSIHGLSAGETFQSYRAFLQRVHRRLERLGPGDHRARRRARTEDAAKHRTHIPPRFQQDVGLRRARCLQLLGGCLELRAQPGQSFPVSQRGSGLLELKFPVQSVPDGAPGGGKGTLERDYRPSGGAERNCSLKVIESRRTIGFHTRGGAPRSEHRRGETVVGRRKTGFRPSGSPRCPHRRATLTGSLQAPQPGFNLAPLAPSRAAARPPAVAG